MTDLKKLRKLAVAAFKYDSPFTISQFQAAANPQAIIEVLDMVDRYREALRFYAKDSQFSTGEKMTDSQKRDMDDYGSRAREALEGRK